MRALILLSIFASPAFANGFGNPASAEAAAESKAVSSVTTERQAPSVSQGSLVLAGCGAGANAGGSNTHGAAFLGIQIMTKHCKLLGNAAAYQALGMYDAACEMVNGTRAAKRRWKELGKEPPPCTVKPPEKPAEPSTVVNVTQADTSAYATRQELSEVATKVAEKSVGK